MRIAVVGGTGLVGAMVVDAAAAAGHETVVVARSRGVDVVSGQGLEAAFEGVDVVIDTANVATLARGKSVAFFETATRKQLDAERRTGVGHHVVLSIVGIDRVPSGYYAGKLRQEEIALSCPAPATVLRATQFHEFAVQLLQRVRGPVALVPKMRSQPIAAREVAAALVAAAEQPAAGLLPDLAGPQVREMPDLVRQVLRARGSRKPVLAVRLPGEAGRAMASGGNLPTGSYTRGTQTFEQWLAAADLTSGSAASR